jgi:hypothetical protein
MADIASRFRIAVAEHKADYLMNLQFCCDIPLGVGGVSSPED